MQKIKKILVLLVVSTVLSSCSEYSKVLNKGLNKDKYKMAVELYDKGDYKKAVALFEKLIGPYAGKPQMERIQYMIANSYYETGDYSLSSYYFSKFLTNYPKSTKVDQAAFLSAKSYYLAAPNYSLDQQDTEKALAAFQNYIDKYPNSKLAEEANRYYKDLVFRLEKKDFEIAKQYYHMEKYHAAITAFDTFNEEHLGSKLKEEAMYLKFMASYDLGMKSIMVKKEKRLKDAQLASAKFKRAFPKSDKLKEINQLDGQIEEEILKTRELFAKVSLK